MTDLVGTKRGFAIALHSGDPAFDGLPGYFMGHLEPALEELLGATRASGDVVRADVSATDVLRTVALLCQPIQGAGLRFHERMIRVFIEGLRHS